MTTTTTTTTTNTTTAEKEEEKEERVALLLIEEEKEEKRQLVLSIVKTYCQSDSKFNGLAEIGKGLEEEENEKESGVEEEESSSGKVVELVCQIISGGKTNYSYKLYLNNNPSKAVFAKIAFDYALWNPDRSVFYDVKRIENEFELMKKMELLMKENNNDSSTGSSSSYYSPVAQPYYLHDIDEHSKLLITEWAEGDEQWANQYIDGIVDKRVLPKLATAIATLNCVDVIDPNFNDNVRPCLVSLFPQLKTIFQESIDSYSQDDNKGTIILDESILYAIETNITSKEFNFMMDAMENEYVNERNVLIHNDTHVFNLLVEKKPSISTLERFGPTGNIYICDWEMAVIGPQGADPGKVMSYPVACAICHAMNGNKLEAYHILDCINEFYNFYEIEIISRRKPDDCDELFLINLYRETLGWLTFMLYNVFYQMNILHDTMPLQDLSSELNLKAKGSYAIIGLQLMKFAYGSDHPSKGLSLKECKQFFDDIMHTKIDELLDVAAAAAAAAAAANKRRGGGTNGKRRSSLLRTTGRRVSVSNEMVAEVQRRMSSQSQL